MVRLAYVSQLFIVKNKDFNEKYIILYKKSLHRNISAQVSHKDLVLAINII